MIYFQRRALFLTLVIGSIVSATTVMEDSKVESSLTQDTRKQTKRGTEDNRQQNNNFNTGNLSLVRYAI